MREDKFYHDFLCGTYTSFLETRTSPSHRAAFLFPIENKAPQLTWLITTPKYIIEHTRKHEPDHSGQGIYEVEYTSKIHIGDRDLPNWCRHSPQTAELPRFAIAGSSPEKENQCLLHLLGRSEPSSFTGEVLAVRIRDMADKDSNAQALTPVIEFGGVFLGCTKAEVIEDVSPMDLRHMMEYLRNSSVPEDQEQSESGARQRLVDHVEKWLAQLQID